MVFFVGRVIGMCGEKQGSSEMSERRSSDKSNSLRASWTLLTSAIHSTPTKKGSCSHYQSKKSINISSTLRGSIAHFGEFQGQCQLGMRTSRQPDSNQNFARDGCAESTYQQWYADELSVATQTLVVVELQFYCCKRISWIGKAMTLRKNLSLLSVSIGAKLLQQYHCTTPPTKMTCLAP